MYKYLVGGSNNIRARLFSMVPMDRTSVSGHELKHKKFHLNIRKYFFTVRMAEHWDQLRRLVVESSSLDTVLSNLLWVTLLEKEGWIRVCRGPFEPQVFCVSVIRNYVGMDKKSWKICR